MNSVTITEGTALFPVDELVYSRDAVLRTCYWFTDKTYIFISRPREGILLVSMRIKDAVPTLEIPSPPKLEVVAGEFQNALLDQQLRSDIEKQTRAVRELLVAKAFAESGALEDLPPGEVRDSVDLVRFK